MHPQYKTEVCIVGYKNLSMKKYLLIFSCFCLISLTSIPGFAQVKFRKQMIAAESFESVNVLDVNNDGKLDIVSGAFWYEGPQFITRHFIGNVERTGPTGEYWDDFATIPMDVNGDGRMDVISGDWFSKSMWWLRKSR